MKRKIMPLLTLLLVIPLALGLSACSKEDETVDTAAITAANKAAILYTASAGAESSIWNTYEFYLPGLSGFTKFSADGKLYRYDGTNWATEVGTWSVSGNELTLNIPVLTPAEWKYVIIYKNTTDNFGIIVMHTKGSANDIRIIRNYELL